MRATAISLFLLLTTMTQTTVTPASQLPSAPIVTSTTSRPVAEAPKFKEPATPPRPQPKSSGNGQPPTKRPMPKSPAPQGQKGPGRSSKPIINWFQRKLAGRAVKQPSRRVADGAITSNNRVEDGTVKATRSGAPKSPTRKSSSPFPQPSLLVPPRNSRNESATASRRKPISLNGDDDGQNRSYPSEDEDDVDRSTNRSSLARESTWSPTSNLEADEDASVRPLPPSGPPSPSPSVSASSYLSDPHTFRSIAASTKPTTLLSIDLAPNGVAHIAQAPNTPSNGQSPRFMPHVRSNSAGTSAGLVGSGASITFSALAPSPTQSSSRPSSLNNNILESLANANSQMGSVQAPLHTSHHPRNNPRPSSPPQDNASMLTLASSAYAMSGTRMGITTQWQSSAPSAMAGDSMSHFGGSFIGDGEGDVSSQFGLEGDRDVDASVRALRPRSSRRGSWDSEASDWSAPVGSAGTPSRSVWTTNSIRTGGVGANGRSEDAGSIAASEKRSLEPQTPLQNAEVLPAESEDIRPSLERSPSPKGVETTPKRQKGQEPDLSAEDAPALPLPSPNIQSEGELIQYLNIH